MKKNLYVQEQNNFNKKLIKKLLLMKKLLISIKEKK
jgi:hypothetical protein